MAYVRVGALIGVVLRCVALLVTLAAGPARAVEVGAFVGPRLFSVTNELGQPEGFKGGFDNTVLPGLRVGVRPVRWLGLEGELAGGRSALKHPDSGSVAAWVTTARAHVVGRYDQGDWHALAMAGGGAMHSAPSTDARFVNDTDAFTYAGLGLGWQVRERLAVRMDTRLVVTGSTEVGQATSRDGEATLALSWRFGDDSAPRRLEPDADRDGIPDERDRCPYDAETFNEVRDEDGCPESPVVVQRYHQTRFVPTDHGKVARLTDDRLGDGSRAQADNPVLVERKAAELAPPPTPSADDVVLAKLDEAMPLAENALPPLVSPRDDDLDGIDGRDDICPDAAEDFDGFEDSDGCPDPDNDRDGVPDGADRCPFDGETVNGVRDEDGCPEHPHSVLRHHKTRYATTDGGRVVVLPEDVTKVQAAETVKQEKAKVVQDQGEKVLALLPEALPLAPDALPPLVSAGDDDRDGFPRAIDVCPDQAEDFDGFEDSDGCPEPDNDRDGVPDGDDKCPTAAETPNGYEDADGCPDEVPIPLAKRGGAMRGIEFATNSAAILPNSTPALEPVVALMKRYPHIRVEIAGHTDDRGEREANIVLSQKRADAVRDWFVEHGAAVDHIQSVGYGPDKPKAPGRSAKARAVNRRVEFNLITGDEPGNSPENPP